MAMAKIRIPKEAVAPLSVIANFEDSDFDRLHSAIASAKPTLTRSQFTQSVCSLFDIKEEEVGAILSAV